MPKPLSLCNKVQSVNQSVILSFSFCLSLSLPTPPLPPTHSVCYEFSLTSSNTPHSPTLCVMNSNSIMSSTHTHSHPHTWCVMNSNKYYVCKQPTPTTTHTPCVLWIQTALCLQIQTGSSSVLCLSLFQVFLHLQPCGDLASSWHQQGTELIVIQWTSGGTWQWSNESLDEHDSGPANLWRNMTVIQWISGGTWQRSSESLEEHDMDPVNLWRNMTVIQWISGGTWLWFSESLEEHDSGYK